jgi:hypothetical protein
MLARTVLIADIYRACPQSLLTLSLAADVPVITQKQMQLTRCLCMITETQKQMQLTRCLCMITETQKQMQLTRCLCMITETQKQMQLRRSLVPISQNLRAAFGLRG